MMEKTMYKARKVVAIVKRAIETGDAIEFTKQDLFSVAQARADKEIFAPTAALRFAKYVESDDGRAMMAAMRLAPSAPAAAPPRTAYEMLQREREDHIRKARNDADDRRRVVQDSINAMTEQMLQQHPGLTRDAARQRVLSSPHVRAMLRARPIVDRAQAG
jgi:hypothetical protein